jgi:hypothetical protein
MKRARCRAGQYGLARHFNRATLRHAATANLAVPFDLQCTRNVFHVGDVSIN